MHYIQAYILDTLTRTKILRNKDMRPPKVESNLYQYHLLQLQKEGYVKKLDSKYTLSKRGLAYASKHSSTLKKERPQPQVLTILFVTNPKGQLFVRTKQRQPFIGMQGLVLGKVHIGESVNDAVVREYQERVSDDVNNIEFEIFGTAHIVVKQDDCIISDYIGLLASVNSQNNRTCSNGVFYSLDAISSLNLAPGVSNLINAYINKATFTEAILNYKD